LKGEPGGRMVGQQVGISGLCGNGIMYTREGREEGSD
jgi:hypothetical protein